ncbi:unnamed protein product [Hymenolepis diminuta]|uniref:Uncharacterized protein n=1 Tax=Hymenolepis diminuta TaxID=6216 RepID=A0A564YX19_HYMDI|nr:unnamed protein product [Hymenolepis diminuta]
MYRDQTIMLRWSVNKRDINEIFPTYGKVAENIGMFAGDVDIQIANLPQKCTIRCTVYSTIITGTSKRIQISRNKRLRVDLKGR